VAPVDTATVFPRSSDFRFLVTQPLLRGFGPNTTFYDLRNSRRSRESQERQYDLGRQRLIVDVTRSYYQVLQQRQLLAVAAQSLARSESLRKASTARLEVGLVSKLDVYRAELQASQAQESMVRAETSLDQELERFRTLLGLSPADPLQPEDVVLPEEVKDDVEPVEILTQRALQNRLDLLETSDEVDDARRTATLAKQNLLPQLDLNVGVTQIGTGPTFGRAISSSDRQVNVYFSTSYPLERSNEAANKAGAELDVNTRERTLRQRQLDVETEVRTAVRELQRIRKSIELQRKGMEVAEQQRRLATLRYQRGLASNFDVVDAEGSLVVARSALVGLVTSYQVARVDLMRVTGELKADGTSIP
jgi:outer membrane protein TolC